MDGDGQHGAFATGFEGLVAATSALAQVTSHAAPTREEVVRGLCRAVAMAVPVDGVGGMLSDGTALRFVHAEPDWVVPVERLQELHARGPCWDSLAGRQVVAVDDVRTSDRWPELADRARSRLGGPSPSFQGVASLPLVAQGQPLGVLDLYRRDHRPWTEPELAAAAACSHVAASQLILIADRERWQVAWERAEHRSTHDVLTGLPARGLLFDRLDHALATMTGRDGAVAVLFIDVARTRPDEDTGGQRTGHRGPDDLALDGLGLGDWALGEIAHRLSQTLRVDDTLARLSGGEFVIVCEALTGTMAGVQDWLHEFGERILLELRRPEPGRTVLDVSVSIGAAVTTSVCSALHLTSQAEMARYAAKHSGGNRLVIHRNARRP